MRAPLTQSIGRRRDTRRSWAVVGALLVVVLAGVLHLLGAAWAEVVGTLMFAVVFAAALLGGRVAGFVAAAVAAALYAWLRRGALDEVGAARLGIVVAGRAASYVVLAYVADLVRDRLPRLPVLQLAFPRTGEHAVARAAPEGAAGRRWAADEPPDRAWGPPAGAASPGWGDGAYGGAEVPGGWGDPEGPPAGNGGNGTGPVPQGLGEWLPPDGAGPPSAETWVVPDAGPDVPPGWMQEDEHGEDIPVGYTGELFLQDLTGPTEVPPLDEQYGQYGLGRDQSLTGDVPVVGGVPPVGGDVPPVAAWTGEQGEQWDYGYEGYEGYDDARYDRYEPATQQEPVYQDPLPEPYADLSRPGPAHAPPPAYGEPAHLDPSYPGTGYQQPSYEPVHGQGYGPVADQGHQEAPYPYATRQDGVHHQDVAYAQDPAAGGPVADVDPETRLWTARYFRDRLSAERERSQVTGTGFSVVMVQVVDTPFRTLPHRRQVALLRELGHQFIQAQVVDHLVHLPDEGCHWFAVVLAGTDRAGAHTFERRLRSALAGYLRNRGLGLDDIQSATLTSPDDDETMAAIWSSLLGEPEQGHAAGPGYGW